jgi:hypothetical protein
MPSKTTTEQIRALNDQLRQRLTGGRALITPGVAALGPIAVARIVKTIAVFDDFCQANDPYDRSNRVPLRSLNCQLGRSARLQLAWRHGGYGHDAHRHCGATRRQHR